MAVLTRLKRLSLKHWGSETLTVEELAVKAGYEVSGYFRRTVSSLRKCGILANKRPGYYLKPEYHYLLKELGDY